MEFRQLETFVQVVKLESFSKAAQQLYLTQPTVTSHIQALEEELETLLLNRYGKRATTTEAGEILYKYALDLVHMRNMAQFDLSAYNGKIQGDLIISSSSVPRNYLLPKMIKEFTKTYPEISFTINERDSEQVFEDIKGGYADFGIVGARYDSNYIDYVELMEDRLCVITPNTDDFPEENGSYVDKSILTNNRLILREEGSGTRKMIEELILPSKPKKEDRDKFDKTSFIEDGEAIKRFVEVGMGVSIVSELTVKNEVEKGTLKKFHIEGVDLSRSFYFAFHNRRELSPLNKKFKEFVLEEETLESLKKMLAEI